MSRPVVAVVAVVAVAIEHLDVARTLLLAHATTRGLVSRVGFVAFSRSMLISLSFRRVFVFREQMLPVQRVRVSSRLQRASRARIG